MTEAPFAIGVDIGGTRLRAALIDRDGTVLARTETLTRAKDGPDAVVAQIVELCATVTASIGGERIAGAGISAPGPIDTVRGVALGVPTLSNWHDIPIVAMIEDALGLRVRLENDAIAAANGEWRFGAGRDLSNLVYVTVSTGVGGGVVLDGRLLHGRMGMAAHVGHMIVQRGGERCSCGASGCWEAYASGTAFARRIRARTGAASGPAEIFAAARAGDVLAGELVAEEGAWLGVGVAGLLHLYSPEAVILGGGVSNGFDLFRPAMEREIAALAMPAFRDVPVVQAGLGENSGLVGAAALLFS